MGADAGPSLRDYLAVLWRQKWYIWLVTAVVLTVAMLGFIADRIYLVLMHRMLRWQA